MFGSGSRFEFIARTEKGPRPSNQDACLAVSIGEDLAFLAVADGMGGHAGGEIASSTIIDTAETFFEETEYGEITGDLRGTLRRMVQRVSDAVRNRIAEEPDLADMGSTLVCTLVHRDRYVVANIGDSRLYVGKPRALQQVTRDHSYVREFLDAHPKGVDPKILGQYANVITRAVDGSIVEADIYPEDAEAYRLRRGEMLLLCSDGLIPDKLSSPERAISAIAAKKDSLDDTAGQLVRYALDNDSQDNISVVLAMYRGGRGPFMQGRFIGE